MPPPASTASPHIEVIYHFNRVPDAEIQTGARHPRGRTDWPKVGIFAQRGKGRPNRLGLTTCMLLSVEGLVLHVRGLDAIDGTPVLRHQAGDERLSAAGHHPRAGLGRWRSCGNNGD